MAPSQLIRNNDAKAIRAVRRSLKGLQRVRIVLPPEGVEEVRSWENDFDDAEEQEERYESGNW